LQSEAGILGPGNKQHCKEQGVSMGLHQRKLLGGAEVAEGTMAFQLERPKDFIFKLHRKLPSALPQNVGDATEKEFPHTIVLFYANRCLQMRHL
jgi:hypothetical protein